MRGRRRRVSPLTAMRPFRGLMIGDYVDVRVPMQYGRPLEWEGEVVGFVVDRLYDSGPVTPGVLITREYPSGARDLKPSRFHPRFVKVRA